ncbi:MAG: NAD(P)/FAD-dependent oxidoreductase [Candidatus Omnitrophica bacterium]|nr:NAD(P)/FAD-dependent oxidoreductase [Candidatus Omnitrophota bacterium]
MKKILIVGAGPVGCYLAHLLKRQAPFLKVSLIEEHPSSGEPLHCAGLVSRSVFDEAQIKFSEDSIINWIDSAQIYLNGDTFQIMKKEVAIVLDRKKFDHNLSKNLDINYSTRFFSIKKDKNGYIAITDKGDIYADIIIGADGANSLLRKTINFQDNVQYYSAAQVRLETDNIKRHQVKVYLKKPFFAWVIPETENICRIGIIGNNPYQSLIEFLKEINLQGRILEKFGGILPLGFCQTQKDNLALVGDAACQVKPLTHGGIYYGMRCAEVLCDCIVRGEIHNYESIWRSKFGKEIEMGLKVKRLYEDLDEGGLYNIFKFLKKNKNILEKFGSFDRHSAIILKLIHMRKFQQLLGTLLLRLI